MNINEKQKLKSLLQTRKGVIFDFDGVLVDSEPYHYQAYDAAFQEHGHVINPEEYWVEFTSKGKGAQGEIDRYGLEGLDAVEIRKRKFVFYSEFCKKGEIKFFPMAKKLVHLIKAKGFKMAIASGSRNEDIRTILEINDFNNTFHTILGKESAPKEKPAPDIFIKAAEELELDPKDLMVVEDAEKGLRASRDAGIPCVMVRKRLNLNIDFPEADFICDSLDELADLFEKI